MTQQRLSRLFRSEILTLSAYQVADASGYIKLDAMENPYHWSDNIKQQWLACLKRCEINRYPDPEAKQLSYTLKLKNQVPESSAILLGNGSDEIIQLLLMALPPESHVLAPHPGFVMYPQIANSLGLNYHAVPLLADSFELDLPTMLESIEHYQPALIFLAYPNNPTGNLFSADAINTIIKATDGLVIVDEAYAPFANASFIQQLTEYDNLLVMRTVSKLGLAGLRLGYIVGDPAIIEQLNKIRLPYNINSLTQVTADFALNQSGLFEQQTEQICRDRSYLSEQLSQLSGITVYPSAANFILFKTPKNEAEYIFNGLKEKGILIKNLSSQGGLLTDCLRVTVGTSEENKLFLEGIKKVIL